ncbi:MAG: hypothetical protein IIA62_08940, partial [Nitrospinae bacterium]|nr:hypothetical protein [Nitrospinota bacterium]
MNISTDTLNKRGENSGRSMISRARGEAGAALVMALLFLLILAIMVPVAMRMIAGDTSRTGDYNESRRAFYIADAGIEVAKSLIRYAVYDDFLAGPDEDPDTDADNGVLFVLNTDGSTTLWGTTVSLTMNTDGDWEEASAGSSGNYTRINYNDGQFYARVFDNEDENPNDPNDDSDYILQVHVVGVTDQGAQSSIMAAYRKYDIPEDEFPAAVTMVGVGVGITASGNIEVDGGHPTYAWDLQGYDVTGGGPNSRPVADTDCLAESAISLESSEAAASIDWNNAEDNFNGIDEYDETNDIASIEYDQTDFTADNSVDLRLEVKDYCTICELGNVESDPYTNLPSVLC